jgi:drug/metabolite transporter (DMT)-like permease
MQRLTLAKLMVAYSGVAWGLFWLPLRTLEAAGIGKLWTLLLFNGLPFLLALPVIAWRWRTLAHGWRLWSVGLAMGATQVLYSLSLLKTEVVDAIVLFYLNPIWAMLLARIFLGERLTPLRWMAIAMAFVGMATVLGTGATLPIPKNSGDWLAVAAGMGWAASIILLKFNQDARPIDLTLQNCIGTAILLVPLVWLMDPGAAPAAGIVAAQLWWLIPFIILVFMTGVYSSMWAVPLLPPAIVGLLYMTEISSGAISAALLSGERLGWREAIGIALITLAGALESLVEIWRTKQAARA